jgi:hypothetical protein
LFPGSGFDVFGRRWTASTPMRFIQRGDMATANLVALAVQKIAQHPAVREQMLQMQVVDAAHATDVQNLA